MHFSGTEMKAPKVPPVNPKCALLLSSANLKSSEDGEKEK